MYANVSGRDVISDRGIGILNFDSYLNFKFGYPNDEALPGYPYYELGSIPYSFYKLEDSDWIKGLIEIEKSHPLYREDIFDDFNHYILIFRDSIFECIAKEFIFEYSEKSMGELLSGGVKELILANKDL